MWDRDELLHAIQQQTVLEFCYPGLLGRIISVEDRRIGTRTETWLTVKTLFPGTAFFPASQIRTRPPVRLAAGRRVRTAFGPGRVLSLRRGSNRLDYVVELTHSKLANNKYPIAYLGVDDAHSIPFPETLAAAEAEKNRGNALLKKKDWTGAINSYVETVSILRDALSLDLSKLERAQMLDAVVKALSNKAQVFLSLPEPDYRNALEASDEVRRVVHSVHNCLW